MNKLTAVAAAFALSFAAFSAAQAQTVETIEIVGHANGCATVYQDTVSDDGKPMSEVTLVCPRPQPATQIAQEPPVGLEQVVDKLN
jgi:hypothetical protein